MSTPRLGKVIFIVVLAMSCARLSEAADLTLAWDPPNDGMTTGFVLYYGTASRSYSQQLNVGPATSYTVTGLSAGTTYYFAVRSYDAAGDLSDLSAEVSGMTGSPVVSSLSLTSNLASPQGAGATVTWSATATGGEAPYQFQWAVLEADQWTVWSWSSASNWAWSPAAAGSYLVKVAVRSAGSISTTGELTQTAPFTVTVPISVSLTSQLRSPQPAGTTIPWSVTVSGGTAPYQYRWWVFNGSSWTAMTTWTTSSTWSWKPGSPNDGYMVRVWVRSAGNSADAPDASTSVSFPISKKCQGAKCR
jgi:hypothetical protein